LRQQQQLSYFYLFIFEVQKYVEKRE
jgi:hypothetical protein